MSSLGLQDDRRLATLCAIGAAIVLPCVDAMVKWLVADYTVVMVAWVRMGVIAVVLSGPDLLVLEGRGLVGNLNAAAPHFLPLHGAKGSADAG